MAFPTKIINILDLDVSKIYFTEFDMKKKDNYNGKRLYLSYHDNEQKYNFSITTPKIKFPFGLQKWVDDNSGKVSYSMVGSFTEWKDTDELTDSKKCLDKFLELQKRLTQLLWENYEKVFEEKIKKDFTFEKFEYTERFVPILKLSKDEEKYSPSIKIAVPYYPTNVSNKFPTKVCIKRGEFLDICEDDPQNTIPKQSNGHVELKLSLYMQSTKRTTLSMVANYLRLVDYTKFEKENNPFLDIDETDDVAEGVNNLSLLDDDDLSD